MRTVVVLLAMVMLGGCDSIERVCETGDRLKIERQELKNALLTDLVSAGIAVQESPAGEICYPSNKANFVGMRLRALELEQRPRNRITLPDGRVRELAYDRFEQAGIDFEAVDQDGEVVLILENEASAARAFEIIREVFAEYYGASDAT